MTHDPLDPINGVARVALSALQLLIESLAEEAQGKQKTKTPDSGIAHGSDGEITINLGVAPKNEAKKAMREIADIFVQPGSENLYLQVGNTADCATIYKRIFKHMEDAGIGKLSVVNGTRMTPGDFHSIVSFVETIEEREKAKGPYPLHVIAVENLHITPKNVHQMAHVRACLGYINRKGAPLNVHLAFVFDDKNRHAISEIPPKNLEALKKINIVSKAKKNPEEAMSCTCSDSHI